MSEEKESLSSLVMTDRRGLGVPYATSVWYKYHNTIKKQKSTTDVPVDLGGNRLYIK